MHEILKSTPEYLAKKGWAQMLIPATATAYMSTSASQQQPKSKRRNRMNPKEMVKDRLRGVGEVCVRARISRSPTYPVCICSCWLFIIGRRKQPKPKRYCASADNAEWDAFWQSQGCECNKIAIRVQMGFLWTTKILSALGFSSRRPSVLWSGSVSGEMERHLRM